MSENRKLKHIDILTDQNCLSGKIIRIMFANSINEALGYYCAASIEKECSPSKLTETLRKLADEIDAKEAMHP